MLGRRFFSATAATVKANVALVAQLRKEIDGVSVSKARQALIDCNNDINLARRSILQSAQQDGLKRAAKVHSRTATDGVVALVERNGLGAAMVELNCETDFVARNNVFQELATRITSTALLLQNTSSSSSAAIQSLSMPALLNMPLLPHPSDKKFMEKASADILHANTPPPNVEQAVVESIGKLGERIVLRRGALVMLPNMLTSSSILLSSFMHNSLPGNTLAGSHVKLGKLGTILVTEIKYAAEAPLQIEAGLEQFGQKLAQHVAGMKPHSIDELMSQAFLFDPAVTVGDKIKQMVRDNNTLESMQIFDMRRFECGEDETEVIQNTQHASDSCTVVSDSNMPRKRAFA